MPGVLEGRVDDQFHAAAFERDDFDGAIAEAACNVQPTPVVQVFEEGFEDISHHSGRFPVLEAAVTGLVGRVFRGQEVPGGAGAQDIQDAVQDGTVARPGATTAIGPRRRGWDEGVDEGPLFVGEVHWIADLGFLMVDCG